MAGTSAVLSLLINCVAIKATRSTVGSEKVRIFTGYARRISGYTHAGAGSCADRMQALRSKFHQLSSKLDPPLQHTRSCSTILQ
eukprot:1148212-Pelagomonas_calceolata.AAC.1